MDSQRPVLVCSQRHGALATALLDTGHVPLVRNRIDEALETLRHERIEGILVNASHTDVDVLEFVLNVRDVDEGVPIVVTASDAALEGLGPALREISGVRVAPANASPEQAVAALERILGALEKHS